MRKRGSRNEPYESTVQGAFDDAKSEVETLADEIREWCDSLESNGMEHLPKYEEVSEAAEYLEEARDTLDSVFLSDLGSEVEDLPIKTSQDTRRKAMSRSGRRGNATVLLYAVKDALQGVVDADRSFLPEAEKEAADEKAEEVQSALEEVGNAIDALENVCFPGMY